MTRYGCVNVQYRDGSETHYTTDDRYWIIVRCDPVTFNATNGYLCENPGIDESVDSIVPVTELSSMVHYRNKYCAYCNGIGEDEKLINWKVKVLSFKYISLPDNKLLAKVRQVHGNIIFEIPGQYIHAHKCNVPSYEITTCNSTGLWLQYDSGIDIACQSFIDPFNFTFKNYFCYLCNSAETLTPDQWMCKSWLPNEELSINIVPPFFAISDVSIVKGGQSSTSFSCGTTQFKDEIMVSKPKSLRTQSI